MIMPTLEEVRAWDPKVREDVRARTMPRWPVGGYIPQVPHPPQQSFLIDPAKEAFYGGAAGGAKSSALLMAALQYIDVPRYSALLLRRTYTDLMLPGALMERAEQWLKDTNARPMQSGKKWIFPSGATLTFGSLQYESDLGTYKSSEYQFIGFDELTEFPQRSYRFMFSRLRGPAINCERCGVLIKKVRPGTRLKGGDEIAGSTGWIHKVKQTNYSSHCDSPTPNVAMAEFFPPAPDGTTLFDVPLRMRSASNPGGPGHEWVRDRFVTPETRLAATKFHPARITDNPSLDQEAYIDSLSLLGEVDKARLLEGRWDIQEEGRFFEKAWFKVVPREALPTGAHLCRYWDLAATEAKKGADPDWTVGALVATYEGYWWVVDVVRVRGNPGEVQRLIDATTSQDPYGTLIRMEQEPGASGKSLIDVYRRSETMLGKDFDGTAPTGAKDVRARPVANAAHAGNVAICAGEWNRVFLDEFGAFPQVGIHDDQVDAVSGAFFALSQPPKHKKMRIIS